MEEPPNLQTDLKSCLPESSRSADAPDIEVQLEAVKTEGIEPKSVRTAGTRG